MCWWVITFFVIFAVLDVSLAVNLCINRGFLHLLRIVNAAAWTDEIALPIVHRPRMSVSVCV